jgi:hypothetical protein
MGERTRINARRSVTLLPLQAYALGWSMRLLGATAILPDREDSMDVML